MWIGHGILPGVQLCVTFLHLFLNGLICSRLQWGSFVVLWSVQPVVICATSCNIYFLDLASGCMLQCLLTLFGSVCIQWAYYVVPRWLAHMGVNSCIYALALNRWYFPASSQSKVNCYQRCEKRRFRWSHFYWALSKLVAHRISWYRASVVFTNFSLLSRHEFFLSSEFKPVPGFRAGST